MNSGSCVQMSSSRKLPIHVVQNHHTGELVSPKMVISFVCLVPVRLLLPSLAAKGTHQFQWWCTVESLLGPVYMEEGDPR